MTANVSARAPERPRQVRGRRGGRRRKPRRAAWRRALAPLPWLAPALVLICGVVLWPVVEMVRTSFLRIGSSGYVRGGAGLAKYRELFSEPVLPHVLWRTVEWVVVVVAATLVISLALASLLNRRFPGRTVVRWALIVPWAASVVMSAIIFKWILDWSHGVFNTVLMDLHLIDKPVDWLGTPQLAFWWMCAVAVFVSVPFTTYVCLAGLQAIPSEVYEAAQVDGCGPWTTYRRMTFPLLRPALLVGSVINIINVFNSFPIIYTMYTGAGYLADTSTIYMYKLKGSDIGESAAMAVVNFVLILLLVLLYLKVTRWKEATS